MNHLYKERQRFNQWWLWLIIVGANAMSIAVAVQRISQHAWSYYDVLQIGFSALVMLFFFSMKLETRISDEGIEVRFFPLHLSYIKISWKEIDSAKVRTYSALGEYGGWGIRYGFSKAGKAYNVSGNDGIQLLLKDGSKLLIGTHKKEEVEKILQQLNS